MFKKKEEIKEKKNTHEIKLQTALEEEIRVKDENGRLKNKIIALQDENIVLKDELIVKYRADIAKLKYEAKKGK